MLYACVKVDAVVLGHSLCERVGIVRDKLHGRSGLCFIVAWFEELAQRTASGKTGRMKFGL